MRNSAALLRRPLLSLDELATHAWSEEVRAVGTWHVRRAGGFTLRANSVLPLASPAIEVNEAIDEVEWLYAIDGIVPSFQVASDAHHWDLASRLVARGYLFSGHSEMWVADISAVLEDDNGRSPRERPAGRIERAVTLSRRPEATWFESWFSIAGYDERYRPSANAVLDGAPRAARFAAAVTEEGDVAGVAMGVVEQGSLGIFCVGTDPRMRRAGVAREVVGAVGAWGAKVGATSAYLQVTSKNMAAKALYSSLGFRYAYDYRFLSQRRF